jgi:hypothetical protein
MLLLRVATSRVFKLVNIRCRLYEREVELGSNFIRMLFLNLPTNKRKNLLRMWVTSQASTRTQQKVGFKTIFK